MTGLRARFAADARTGAAAAGAGLIVAALVETIVTWHQVPGAVGVTLTLRLLLLSVTLFALAWLGLGPAGALAAMTPRAWRWYRDGRAAALTDRRIPFVYLTGYQEPDVDGGPVLRKPVAASALLGALARSAPALAR